MMFHNDLDDCAPPPLPIICVTHKKPIRAVLICRDWVGVRTHWFGKHTIACCGTENCPACEANRAWVKKYYIVGRGVASGNLALLMLTPIAAESLVTGRSRKDGFLGVEISLGRAADRDTAPMTARLCGFHENTQDFGTSRLERVVRRIFRENAGLASD